MRIAVDLDGVLADTITTFCAILNKRYSTHLTPNLFTHWTAWEIAGITKREFLRTLDEAWFSWKAIPPMEENIGDKVAQIGSFGKTDVVTGRSADTVHHAKQWLQEHRVSYDNFIRTTSVIAKVELRYDVFIDDSAELMALLSAREDCHGILYTQPWNRNASGKPGIFRVDQWAQIPNVLRQVSCASG